MPKRNILYRIENIREVDPETDVLFLNALRYSLLTMLLTHGMLSETQFRCICERIRMDRLPISQEEREV